MSALALAATVLALMLLAAPLNASARSRKAGAGKVAPDARPTLRLELIDTALTVLPWDQGLDEVLKWCAKRLDEDYGPRIKAALDVLGRSRLTHQMQDDLRALRDAVVPFDGRRTGYEVSIVAGEFVAGAEESLLVLRLGQVQHYFFFTYGKLWKYARSLKSPLPFAALAEQLAEEHGAPTRIDRRGGSASVLPERLFWEGDKVNMRVLDNRLLYGADLYVLEDHGIASRINELRGGKKPASDSGEVDPDLDDFIGGGE